MTSTEVPTTSSMVENPDAGSTSVEALQLEAEQDAILSEAGVSNDLLALRDAVAATLIVA